jgi:malonyl-CoA decarboxylase
MAELADQPAAPDGLPQSIAKSSRTRPLLGRLLRSLRRPSSPDADRVVALCQALLSERGEVSGARLAAEALAAYQSLDDAVRDAFFARLADEFDVTPNAIAAAADGYRANPSLANLIALQSAVESPRQELFRRFNVAPGGTAVLLDMRRALARGLLTHPERARVDADMSHLFRSWFNGGFLSLQQIDWRSSALVLERLIQYEAVHQIQGWRDLRRRLEADRRCYAFFHHRLPDEPLIFIEAALTRGMSANVQPLLDPDSPVVDPATADCATFYSITNCQEGLRGVSFGNLLIKQVVEDLGRALPRLRTFATISPIPGFCEWLRTSADAAAAAHKSPELERLLAELDRKGPFHPPAMSERRRELLQRTCAQYLLHAKRGGAPFDAVARFHLANGARLERLNWMSDTSEAGMRRSFGLTANYLYRLADVERNHEMYARDCRVVASSAFRRLAQ